MVVDCVEGITETGARWWDEGHKGLSRFGPQRCIIPYVLRLVIVLLGNPIGLILDWFLPPLYRLGGRVKDHMGSILVGYTRSFPQVQVISFLTN
jgi:hypothetical protein